MHGTFRNPLILGDGADPWMVYHDGYYYLTRTGTGTSIQIWRAASLADFRETEPVTIWNGSGERCCQIWAPELHLIDGRWYLYYTASDGVDANHRLYVLESAGTDPLGPYTDRGKLFKLEHDAWGIDATVLRKRDGSLFLVWCGRHEGNALFIAPMRNPWSVSGPPVLLCHATYEWEKGGFPVNEGPVALYRNGRIYLVYSACDTGVPDYALGMLTADQDADVLDPRAWTKSAEPLFQRHDAYGVYGPGHNGFFRSPDGSEDWIVYHAKTTTEYTYRGRSTRAQKFGWNADGTPHFGIPVGLDTDVPLPSGDPGR